MFATIWRTLQVFVKGASHMHYGERFNTISHLIGVLLSAGGLVALVLIACHRYDPWAIVSFSIYGVSLVILYGISTWYHFTTSFRLKNILRRLDYVSIYILIAGSYTPFMLVTLRGAWGWSLFGVNWGLAVFGIVQELILGRHTRLLSMIIYVVMGWLIVIAIKPLIEALPAMGLFWLVAGGVIYTVGIYFFINDERIKHGHGIWHLFVLVGSLCQFFSIALYVA